MSKISELTDGGSLLPTDHLIAVRSGANVKVKADTINVDQIDLGDNEKIRLGNSQDLEIYHNATDSIINDNGTGSLKLQQGGSTKLEVTTTGIDVTGSVVSDGLTAEGTINAYRAGFTQGVQLLGDSGGNQIIGTATNDKKLIIKNQAATQGIEIVAGNKIMDLARGGDISFYDTDGTTASFVYDADAGLTINEAGADRDFRVESDNNANMFYLDAGNDRIGVGSTPNTTFHVIGPNQSGYGTMTIEGNADEVDPRLSFYGSSTTAGTTRNYTLDIFSDVSEKGARYDVPSGYYQAWSIAGTKKMSLASSGYLGINELSPDYHLHVNSGTTNVVAKFESTDSTSVIQFVDGLGNSEFGTSGSTARISPNGSYAVLEASQSAVVLNNAAQDTDFRVESNSNANMLFVDAGNNRVGIGESAPDTPLHVTTSLSGDILTIESVSDTALHGPNIVLHRNSGSPADDDMLGRINFNADDSAGSEITYAQVLSQAKDVTAGTADARLKLGGLQAGTFINYLDNLPTESVFNEDSVDRDFRVESDTNANAIFMNAGTGITTFGHGNTMTGNTYNFQAAALNGFAVGSSNAVYGTVNQGGQDGDLLLVSNAYPANLGASRNVIILGGTSGGSSPKETARFNPEEGAIFNEQSIAAHDFRVESDTNTHMLFVDAGLNRLGIGTSGPTGSVHLKDITDSDGSDVFYVAQNTTSNRIGGYKVLDESGTVSLKMQYDNGGNNASIINPNNGSLAVYLGGTAAANALDDYEEGTWTAGINYGSVGGTAATLSESGGSYVKIGRMVTVNFEADVSNTNSGAGNVYITGLPFTIDDIITPTGLEANGTIAYFTGFASGVNSLSLGADTAGGLALFGQTSSTQTAISSITAAAMGTGEIRGSITYFTT